MKKGSRTAVLLLHAKDDADYARQIAELTSVAGVEYWRFTTVFGSGRRVAHILKNKYGKDIQRVNGSLQGFLKSRR